MFWEILLVAACLFLFLLLSFALHHNSSKALLSHIEDIRSSITQTNVESTFDLGELKEEMLDMVHETISKMQPPTAFDHILGAVAGPLQAWMMRKAGFDPTTGQMIAEQIEEHL